VAETINWEAKEAYALRLTDLELLGAYEDALAAASTVPEQAIGKDASYYRDECAIYRNEWQRRVTIGTLTDTKIRQLICEYAALVQPPSVCICPICKQEVRR
jgi:hypothetical protein